MLLVDPDVPLAVAVVIGSIALSAGALVSALLLSLPASRRRRRVAAALRRGAEVLVVVALLLVLRVVDGLTPVTGAFVVLAFIVAEAVLSARPKPSSR